MSIRRLGGSKAKAALARTNNIQVIVEGAYEDDRQKFQSMSAFLGTYYSGNSVSSMVIDDRVSALEDRDIQLFDSDSMLISSNTVANTTTETTIFTATIPAGFITAPTMIEMDIDGVYSTSNSNDSFVCRVKLNGVSIHTFNSVPKNVVDTPVELTSRTTIRTIGVGGIAVTKANFAAHNDGLFGSSVSDLAINTTVANVISITMEWDNASVNNSGTIKQGIIKLNKNQG